MTLDPLRLLSEVVRPGFLDIMKVHVLALAFVVASVAASSSESNLADDIIEAKAPSHRSARLEKPISKIISENLGAGLGNKVNLKNLTPTQVEQNVQQGIAQVTTKDKVSTKTQDQKKRVWKSGHNADAGASRQDKQERKGDLYQNTSNRQDDQAKTSRWHGSSSHDDQYDKASENKYQHNDLTNKHGGGMKNVGQFHREDINKNSGNNDIAARKNAFTRQNTGFDSTDYGFKKGFDRKLNERGGMKESRGQDNNNVNVYEEKQIDKRLSRGLLDAFRTSHDADAFWKDSEWLSNAAQKQKADNHYRTAEQEQTGAEQQQFDWNALFDRRNSAVWNRENAEDKASRQAKDMAGKRADQHKKSLAGTWGEKRGGDNKYYESGTFGKGTGAGRNTDNTAISHGVAAAAASQSGAGKAVGRKPGHGLVTGIGVVSSGDAARAGVNDLGKVKGRQEVSGNGLVNQQKEKTGHGDLENQKQSSDVLSIAEAYNDYSRGRGAKDATEVSGQQEGKWSKEHAGFRDGRRLGYNGANADLAKASQLTDRAVESKTKTSKLESANKNFQDLRLDRTNYKNNIADSNHNTKKLKKFYHDKSEDGENNEALNFNSNKGGRTWGEDQQAYKQAHTSYNNAADDAKVNTQGRAYDNVDTRILSNHDDVSKQKDNSGRWQDKNQHIDTKAIKNTTAVDKWRKKDEFDSFANDAKQQNQQLWEKARKDVAQRQRGHNKGKAINAKFLFTPQNQNTGFGDKQSLVGKGNIRPEFDSRQFQEPAFGQSSDFGKGLDNPGGSFMDDIGKTKFGTSSFLSSANGFDDSKYKNLLWRK